MQTPLKNVTPSILATPSNNWRPAKSPVFENLLGGYAPPPPPLSEKMDGVHTIWHISCEENVLLKILYPTAGNNDPLKT